MEESISACNAESRISRSFDWVLMEREDWYLDKVDALMRHYGVNYDTSHDRREVWA